MCISELPGGTQWISWDATDPNITVIGYLKEESMSGPDQEPKYPATKAPLKAFLDHLDKAGKVSYELVCHTWERDGGAVVIKKVEDCVLPVPAAPPSKSANAKPNLLNVAGYVDVSKLSDAAHIELVKRVVCPPCC